MQFNLPNLLQMEVLKYDASRQQLAKTLEEQNKIAKRKASHPRGNVMSLGLIPDDIIKPADMQKAIDKINKETADSTFHHFLRLKKDGSTESCAVLYYFKQLWVAFWLPKTSDDYWYGMSIAFRHTSTARKAMGEYFWGNQTHGKSLHTIDSLKETKIGRTTWLHKTIFMTQDLIDKGYTRNYWDDVDDNHHIRSYGKQYQIRGALKLVEEELAKRIPRWRNDRTYKYGYWTRTIKANNNIQYAIENLRLTHSDRLLKEYQHTVEHWQEFYLNTPSFKNRPAMVRLITSPWFRKKLSWMCTKSADALNNAANDADLFDVTQPIAEVDKFIRSCYQVCLLYPDINIDFLISRYDLLVETTFKNNYERDQSVLWLETNLPCESFFNMLSKFHASQLAECEEQTYRYEFRTNEQTNRVDFFWRDWDDTISMLRQVIAYNNALPEDGKQLDPMPKRWRLIEWHDQLMAETWKIVNKNENLPQKLFPKPIKVNGSYQGFTTDDTYTFFQPLDTHMLAHWGREVRNCVGNTSYATGIKKFEHIIVLTMINNKPRYTVQLRVDNGVMHVSQIADIGNRRLSDVERDDIQSAFQEALKLREKQLS
jgi:hypothetical protein